MYTIRQIRRRRRPAKTKTPSAIVHARFDAKTSQLLEQLKKRAGWSNSEVLRRGVHALAEGSSAKMGGTFIGIGQFASGIADLASNKGHLRGLGAVK